MHWSLKSSQLQVIFTFVFCYKFIFSSLHFVAGYGHACYPHLQSLHSPDRPCLCIQSLSFFVELRFFDKYLFWDVSWVLVCIWILSHFFPATSPVLAVTKCILVGVCHPKLLFWCLPCLGVSGSVVFAHSWFPVWVCFSCLWRAFQVSEQLRELRIPAISNNYSTSPRPRLPPSTSLEEQYSTMQTWLCLDSYLHPLSGCFLPRLLINLPLVRPNT